MKKNSQSRVGLYLIKTHIRPSVSPRQVVDTVVLSYTKEDTLVMRNMKQDSQIRLRRQSQRTKCLRYPKFKQKVLLPWGDRLKGIPATGSGLEPALSIAKYLGGTGNKRQQF